MSLDANSAVFSRRATGGKDNWRTPREVFEREDARYHFTIDVAADATNHLCAQWFGPDSPLSHDALSVPWKGHTCWCNPPYSLVAAFIKKGAEERETNRVSSVFLIPSRTDTRWWHRYIYNTANERWHHGVRGHFIKGRLKFINPSGPLREPTPSVVTGRHAPNNSAPFPSVVIHFDGTFRGPQVSVF